MFHIYWENADFDQISPLCDHIWDKNGTFTRAFTQGWFNFATASLARHWINIGPTYCVCWAYAAQNLLENMSSFPGELFSLGDFNLHLDSPSNHTNTFTDFGLRQHADFPTRIHGHWLDLFITRTTCDLIKTVHPSDGLSDHMSVIGDVGVKLVSHPIKKCVFSYRWV